MATTRGVKQLPAATDGSSTSTAPTTPDDQIRGYRRIQRARHQAQRALASTFSRDYRETLERQLNPDQELSLSRDRRANLVPAEVLYSHNNTEARNRVYQHYEEIRDHIVDSQRDLRFIEETSYERLRREGMHHIHVGMMMVRIQMLHRVDAGISAMIVFRDTRWNDDRQIISAMTISMTRGAQLVYAIPDLMLSIHDFYNHIQISVVTRGYGTGWTGGDSNMIITRSLVGRITNTSQANFSYQIQGVADYLASRGVQGVPGQPWTEVNRSGEWELRPSTILAPLQVPTEVISRVSGGGNISLRFAGFRDQPTPITPAQEEEGIIPEGDENTHYAMVLLLDEEDFADPEEVRKYEWQQRKERETEANGWYTHVERNGFEFKVRMKSQTTDDRPIIATGWGTEDDEGPRPPSPEILYPQRRKEPVKKAWKPKGSSSSNNPFSDLDLTKKDSLVSSWLSQLGSSCSDKESSGGEDSPQYDSSNGETEISAKAYAFKEAVELDYPQKVEEALKGLDNLEYAYPAADTSSGVTGENSGPRREQQFIPPNTGNVHYQPANTNVYPEPVNTHPLLDTGYRKQGRYGKPLSPWHLPSAQSTQGAILVLPKEIASHADALAMWENITLNMLREMTFDSLQEKVEYIENLLGPREKEAWVTWRMVYSAEYATLITVADEPRNVTSAVKRVLGVSDPYTGNLHAQNTAYAELERLQCPDLGSIPPFLFRYYELAAQSGKMWAGTELSDKLFRKLPPEIGPTIIKEYSERYPGMTVGVNARIQFISEFVQNLCKQAELQRKLKNLNFCKNIPMPGYYETGSGRKKYGIRKAKTYKGKPHDTHVKVIKNKYKSSYKSEGRKCKCFLCGIEGHFARECPKKYVKPERAAYFEGLGIDTNWDVVSVEPGEPDNDDICSISEGENCNMEDLSAFKTQLPYPVEPSYDHYAFVVVSIPDFTKSTNAAWRVQRPLPGTQKTCTHDWSDTVVVKGQQECGICGQNTEYGRRATCTTCNLNICAFCAGLEYGIKMVPKADSRSSYKYQSRDELIASLYEHNAYLLKQVAALTQEVQQLRETLELNKDADFIFFPDASFSDDKDFFTGGGGYYPYSKPSTSKVVRTLVEELDEVLTEEQLRGQKVPAAEGPEMEEKGKEHALALTEAEMNECAHPEMPIGGNNKLYHVVVSFRIPPPKGGTKFIEFSVNAIIDTGCTCCSLDIKKVPEEAIEEAKQVQAMAGINSTTRVTKRLRNGKMIMAGTEFYTPYISVFEMKCEKIDMLIGCNFIRAMKGGLRLEGTEVTFYKTVTTIQTTLESQRVAYLEELIEEEDLKQEMAMSLKEAEIGLGNKRLLEELKEQGFIGDDPLKHWSKNEVKCKLDIINPEITIEDKPLSHLTLEDKAAYQRHIDALLALKVIRPSTSRHRTAAFIVKSGTTVDPITGEEKRGKERMVFNYKMLNDNTYKDQYTLPGINSIIKSLGTAKIYSKFDLKSGFHQVVMEEESIPWTAFVCPAGLFEWLVMPFGLKNAPAIFQRKMDNCFKGTEAFIAVYIDDILVFSNSIKEHEEHLKIMLNICKRNGLVLSPTKMKIACTEVDFLGAKITGGKVSLQAHIIKKIAQVDDKDLQSLKGLRSWLGVLNYARNYIPKCGTLLGPLYSKTSEHGDRRWKKADWEIVAKIKKPVTELPDLELPPPDAYIVLETDGCMEGWGGVCKWKAAKGSSKGTEKVCSYASGKFPVIKSTIDAEIFAVMELLEKFKIFYLDKREITIRTDCQAIISFYEKMVDRKPSRVRWIGFCDYITNTGITVVFEHIKGEHNQLADQLSRLAQQVTALKKEEIPAQAHKAITTLAQGNFAHLGLLSKVVKVLESSPAHSKRPNKQFSGVLISSPEYPKDESLSNRPTRHFPEPINKGPPSPKKLTPKPVSLKPTLTMASSYPGNNPSSSLPNRLTPEERAAENQRQQAVEARELAILRNHDPYLRFHWLVDESHKTPMEVQKMDAIRLCMKKAELEVAEKLKEALEEFSSIVLIKMTETARFATKDNYWGDWLPTMNESVREIEQLSEGISQVIKKVTDYHL
ncbi:ORF3 [Codonopsis vein clearing virus]|uniref:RNA-directed DNA polymerase n=1 Tax=Codonopsis vein clearing virus TaxID=2510980 RepID=A0A411AUF9_9VIRU|nr:ORF3 [Codonopsis vein clearing virus]QAX91646.1 ORF3 [Codonopsis vein clearing virus]